MATGRHRAIDRVRRERTLEDKRRLLQNDRVTAAMDEIDVAVILLPRRSAAGGDRPGPEVPPPPAVGTLIEPTGRPRIMTLVGVAVHFQR